MSLPFEAQEKGKCEKKTESRFGENHPVCSKARRQAQKQYVLSSLRLLLVRSAVHHYCKKLRFDNFLTYGFFRENNSRSTNLLCSNF